ncbi:MAG: hypothetical protein ACHQXL_00300, partial [Candidatus Limnocylindrales bacterium]
MSTEMSETFQPDDPGRYPPQGPGGPTPTPGAGPTDPPGAAYVRSWSWGTRDACPGLPWIGLFLVLFGGLLLLGQLVPGFHVAGSALGVAAGLAFLFAWATNRGRWGLYPGIFVLSLSLPSFLIDLGLIQNAPGWTTLFLGIGLLAIAFARWRSRGGIGWQGILGATLALVGGADLVSALVPGSPSLDALLGPILLLGLGVLVLLRSVRPR